MRREESHGSVEDQALRSSKEEDSAALSPSTVLSDPSEPTASRFYVMDWLEQLDEMAMEEAKAVIMRNNLKTLMKEKKTCNDPSNQHQQPPSLMGLRPDTLFHQNNQKPNPPPLRSTPTVRSPFQQRSEAIGNGWNAKGLQKAKQGLWQDALCCWENALEIRLQILGDHHPDVANTLNNMGIALGRLGRYQDAMQHLDRALQIRTQHHGKLHLEIAATLHNIGNVLAQMKDYEGALRCLQEAKKTQATLKDHLLVARTANAIGHLHYENGKYERALDAYTEAQQSFKEAGMSEGNEEYDTVLLDLEDTKEVLAGDGISDG
jgi:tetratricopeptide (TPR) repeat protein